MTRVSVKICGVTTPDDARDAADAGADRVGINFVPSSSRFVDQARARAIADAVRGRIELVGVVADLEAEAILELLDAIGLDRAQLHGAESAELVRRLGGRAFKAVRVGSNADVGGALAYPGLLLVDAKVEGALGGTGQRADWAHAARIASSREMILAGGLTPENVAEAIARVYPAGVDVASGVESAPGVKDAAKVRAFIEAARSGSG